MSDNRKYNEAPVAVIFLRHFIYFYIMMLKSQTILSLFLILPFGILYSQGPGTYESENIVNSQIWLDYNPSFRISNSVSVFGDIGARTIIPGAWHRFYVRPSVKYTHIRYNEKTERYRAWEFFGGVGLFYTANLESTDVLEIRPYQGIRAQVPNWNKFRLRHFIRLEERAELGIGSDNTNLSIRLRYMVGNNFYFPGKFFMKGFYVPLYAEFFFGFIKSSQFNDVIRFTPGLGYSPGQEWHLEFNLSYHYTRDTAVEGFSTNDIVFRLRFYQQF